MRVTRWVWVTVAVLVAVVTLAIAIGSVWLNTFIHSDAFRHEIETRAGQTLGAPVQIQTVDFDLFHGVRLGGLVTRVDAAHLNGQGAVTVTVANVSCTYDWTGLFSRKLKLTGVTLDKPVIVLTRQAGPAAASAPASAPTNPDAASAGGGTADSANVVPYQFVLDRAKITQGDLSVRDDAGVAVADLRGIDADANTAGYYEGKDITGRLRIADLVFSSNVHVTDFSTPLTYGKGGLLAKPFEASAFSGRLAGDYELGVVGPSILEINAKGLDMAQIAASVKTDSPGRLSGTLDLQSKWRSVETGEANGEGDAQLNDGKLEGVKLLHQLSQVLRVKELDAPVISKAQTHFEVANRQTRFTGLQIDSTGFQMTGDGVIGFDGSLQADMVLILSRDSMNRIPKEAAAFFIQQPDGTGTIGYRLGGTISNPQTDLMTRMLMQNMQLQNALGKALNRFFHKHDKKQPPAPVAAPAPAPDANLAPPADPAVPPASVPTLAVPAGSVTNAPSGGP